MTAEMVTAGKIDTRDWRHLEHKIVSKAVALKTSKKVFQPAFGGVQHPRAGQNTQHGMHVTSFVFHVT